MSFETLFRSQINDTNARTLYREFKHMLKLMNGSTFEQLSHEFYELKKFYKKINDKLSLSHETNNFNQLPFDEFKKLRSKLIKLQAEKDELLSNTSSEVSSENKDKIEKINEELEYIKLKMDQCALVKSLRVLNNQLSKLNELIEKMDESSDDFFEEAIKSLLSSEFSINEANDYCYASLYGFLDYPFGFDINFKNFSFNKTELFNISNVFYLDAFSFFDFRSYTTDADSLLDSDHINSLKEILFESSLKYEMFDSDDDNYKIMFDLQKKINEVIMKEDKIRQNLPKSMDGIQYKEVHNNTKIKLFLVEFKGGNFDGREIRDYINLLKEFMDKIHDREFIVDDIDISEQLDKPRNPIKNIRDYLCKIEKLAEDSIMVDMMNKPMESLYIVLPMLYNKFHEDNVGKKLSNDEKLKNLREFRTFINQNCQVVLYVIIYGKYKNKEQSIKHLRSVSTRHHYQKFKDAGMIEYFNIIYNKDFHEKFLIRERFLNPNDDDNYNNTDMPSLKDFWISGSP